VSFFTATTAESRAFTSNSPKDLVESTYDVDADFVDFEISGRRLQSKNNNKGSSSSGNTSGSSSTTEQCNFWCQLKNSMAQTVIGLILICVR
jgi:hypothetical protein